MPKLSKKGGRGRKPAVTTPPLPVMTGPLAGWLTIPEYRGPRGAIFPSDHSFRFWLSDHREELLEADCVRQFRGRIFLHPERTDAAVDSIAKAAAERRFRAATLDEIREAERAS